MSTNPLTFLTDLVNRARKSALVDTADTFNNVTVVCRCHAAGTKVRTTLHVNGRRFSTDQIRRMLIATTQDQTRVPSSI